jgi:ferredoxin
MNNNHNKTNSKNSNYLVEVDRSKCIGAATCVALAPKTFKLDQDQIAEVISQENDNNQDKLLAAQSCPSSAIRLIDRRTKKVVWPKSS